MADGITRSVDGSKSLGEMTPSDIITDYGTKYQMKADSTLMYSSMLQDGLRTGAYYLKKASTDTLSGESGYRVIDYTAEKIFSEQVNTDEQARAERAYQAATLLLSTQDKQLDMELQQIQTEHEAIKTEFDAVRKVIDDNVEVSFKIFS